MNMTIRKITIALLAITMLLAGCADGDGTVDVPPDNETPPEEVIAITEEGAFSAEQCETHNPGRDVIMIESKYCGHCKATLPLFQEACDELGITPIILDLSVQEDLRRMQEDYKVSVKFTPTFIFGCEYFVGAQQDKESYTELMERHIQSEGEH